MNTFGTMLRTGIFGESHGECVGVVLDGCPAGLPLSADDLLPDLKRRQGGKPGTTKRAEPDVPKIRSGVLEGKTTGAPIFIEFANSDVHSTDYAALRDTPRPSHADFAAHAKFGGFNDPRGGGHASGRMTLALVAAGAIAKKLLSASKISINAQVAEAGGSKDAAKAAADAEADGDSIGGIVECKVAGVPVGLGEPFFNSVESMLAHIMFSIPAVRAIEFGAGFACAKMRGSECNDAILDVSGKTKTNNSGGVNGGMTNGNELVFRLCFRPTPSIRKTQGTVNLRSGAGVDISISGRHDACIALRAPPVVEGAAALVLADLMIQEGRIPRVLNSGKRQG
jgi:chorismate synthase